MNDRAHLITLEKYMEAVYMHSKLQAHCEQLQAENKALREEIERLKDEESEAIEDGKISEL